MRYLLTLIIMMSAASTAMADEFVCTDVLEGDAFFCELTDADDNEIGSGCFVFAESVQASGLLSADLTIESPGGTVESAWECGCGTREPEETVLCYGVGPAGFPFTAVAGGEVAGDDLVLDTVGITGPGLNGTAVCVRDSNCGD